MNFFFFAYRYIKFYRIPSSLLDSFRINLSLLQVFHSFKNVLCVQFNIYSVNLTLEKKY